MTIDEEQAIKQAVRAALTGVFGNAEFTPQQTEKLINAIVAALATYEKLNPSSRSK